MERIDPSLDVPPVGTADEDSPFVRAAAPVLLKMADLLTDSRTCLALADRNGHVVWRWISDRALSDECDRFGMQYAASFSERQVGTCGIGAALETGRLSTVLGAEHFVEAFQRWACVAAPVMHPITGRPVGVVGRVALPVVETAHNVRYLRTKRERMGHQLSATAEAGQRGDER